MPRELQAASSLPSEEQWGHCGRSGKCGQVPGTGSELSFSQVGGERWLP